MKKIVAATLFCAPLAIPAVAQGPHTSVALNAGASQGSAAAAEMVPVSAASAEPVGSKPLYGGDLATGKADHAALGLPAGPAPALAWIFALGFLGLVVMRRTRASNAF